MPTYQAQCTACGLITAYTASVSTRTATPLCPSCKNTTQLGIFSAPLGYVKGDFKPFVSPVDGSVINSQNKLKEHNVRNNVVSLNEGYSEEKVLKGDIAPKQEEVTSKDEVVEALAKVKQGYKPTCEEAEHDGRSTGFV